MHYADFFDFFGTDVLVSSLLSLKSCLLAVFLGASFFVSDVSDTEGCSVGGVSCILISAFVASFVGVVT